MKMNNLEEIMKMGKAVELMTPGGFVHLSAEQVKNISNIKEINANAGCRGYNMPMDKEDTVSALLFLLDGIGIKKEEIEQFVDWD